MITVSNAFSTLSPLVAMIIALVAFVRSFQDRGRDSGKEAATTTSALLTLTSEVSKLGGDYKELRNKLDSIASLQAADALQTQSLAMQRAELDKFHSEMTVIREEIVTTRHTLRDAIQPLILRVERIETRCSERHPSLQSPTVNDNNGPHR